MMRAYSMSRADTFNYDKASLGTTYRVSTEGYANSIEVICIGIGLYDLDEPLPKWLEERLAVLMLCDPTPPTVAVEGIGRRIDEHTFWVDVDR
jgi:hypothetical protein